MKHLSLLSLIVFSSPALAHPGHLAEQAGHTHLLALAALSGAVAIAVMTIARGIVRRRRRRLAND